MNARDIMTGEVVSVGLDTPTREIARLLLDKGISAVPVIDADGAPVGMVGEGELFARDEAARATGRAWWLEMLAKDETPSSEFLGRLRAADRKAKDVMTAPVVTVGEDTEIREVARLLATQDIRRVPVVRDGRVVGIVSRGDLLRALADSQPGPGETKPTHARSGIFDWVDRHFHSDQQEAAAEHEPAKPPAAAEDISVPAEDFRGLVKDFERGEIQHHEEERRAAAERRQQAAAEMIDHHIDDAGWRTMLHNARQAAERGQTELMLLQFPSELCSDRGRAVSEAEENWPDTLRGEPAELYLRWERDLKPNGFRLAARVLDYPNGMPGDVGLFLEWGE
jgi:CBS domain-containing protein